MKKILTLVLTAVLLTAVIIGSSVLYKDLTADYQGDNLVTDKDAISAQLGQNKPADNQSNPSNGNTQTPANGNESGSPDTDTDSDVNGGTTEDGGSTEGSAPAEGEDNPGNTDNGNGDNTQNGGDQPPATDQEEENKPEPPKNLAPDFTVLDEDGNAVKLSDFRGKPVVLNFWATWCGYCMVEMPDFNTAYGKYPEIQFLMVNATSNSDTVEKAKKAKADNGYNFDIFFDTAGEAVNAYNVTGFPTTYFISAEGELIAVGRGMLNMANIEKGISLILPAKKED